MSGPRLSMRGLRFTYRPGADAVLQDLDADFPAGSMTVITGPSGGGKSTLLYLLGLMLRPTAGQVLWDGHDVAGADDGARSALRAAGIGFVFQDAVLDPSRTVLDNILEGGLYAGLERTPGRRRAAELMTRFGVQSRAEHRPGEVSGGQAQRVALCRALLKEPRVLLADEPTGNLDEATAEVVWQACRESAARGATVIVATHDAARAGSSDAQLVLDAP